MVDETHTAMSALKETFCIYLNLKLYAVLLLMIYMNMMERCDHDDNFKKLATV